MRPTIVLIIAVLLSLSVLAQVQDTTVAHNFRIKADSFYKGESINYDSALFYYHLAAINFEKAKAFKRAGNSLLIEGNCYLRKKKPKYAIPVFKKAIAVLQQIYAHDDLNLINVNKNLFTAYSRNNQIFEGEPYLMKAYEIGSKYKDENLRAYAGVLESLGYFYTEIGDPNKAKDYYLEVAPIYQALLGPNSSRLSGVYVNIGIQFDILGDIDRSIEYYLKANEIDEKTGGKDFWLLAYNYSNLAIAYNQLDNDSITQWYLEKSIEIADKHQIFDVKSNSIVTLGTLYEKKGDIDKAFSLYKQSEGIVKKQLGEHHPRLYESHLPMAKILIKQGKYPEAENYLLNTINAVEKGYGLVHPWLVSSYRVLAETYKNELRYDEALATIEKGIKAANRNETNLLKEKFPLDNLVSPIGLKNLLLEKGKIYEAMGKVIEPNPQTLVKALEAYQEADRLIDHLRRNLSGNGSKIMLQDEAVALYSQAINLCLDLYHLNSKQDYLKEALRFSEKNKATILSETLKASTLTKLQGIPEEIFNIESDLKRKIKVAEQELKRNPNDSSTIKKSFQLKWSYDSLTQELAKKHPNYFDLKYNLEVSSLEDIQHKLKPQQAALSYFKADSIWFVFSITKNSIALNKLTYAELQPKALEAFREMVNNPNSDYLTEAKNSFCLYQSLVEKPLNNLVPVNEIIIIPDGILGYFPFDALISKPYKSEERPHYLIEDYTIAYVNSLTLFTNNLYSETRSENTYIGFAPDYTSNVTEDKQILSKYRNVLSQLTGTKEEVQFASELFRGEEFIGDMATEKNFKSINKSTSILHLAMHALVDDQDPMQSKLLFTDKSDTLEDDKLHAYEIYSLKIPSKLAVLSACNTGYGKINRGEGVMSLSRAFLFAGCPSIVMSLWRAKDKPTATIMGRFFQFLKAEESKHEALRKAKLVYLKEADPLQQHPSNWATFVVLGNTNPITQPIFLTRYSLGFFAFLICFISIIAYLRKRNTVKTSYKEA